MANVRNAYARNLPSNIARHVFQRVQTTGNGHAISTSLIVARPETPLKHKELIDVQKVLEFQNDYSSNVSIAVEHSKRGINDTSLYMAFVQNGAIIIKKSFPKYRMEEHKWIDTNTTIKDVEDATYVSIAFDGTMTIRKGEKSEFITEKEPWVFWINEAQECWAEKLGYPDTRFKCAENNCTCISTFRATWSEVSKFNFGLMLFMLLNGSIYYRQYINGVWYDAAPINFGPANTTFTSIKVNRTWDYRICIQAKATDGKMYEMFSQFEGIGTRNVEHIDVPNVSAKGTYTCIAYRTYSDLEHIDIPQIEASGVNAWAYTSIPIYAENIPDTNGDYGHYVRVTFDHPLKDIATHYSQFYMIDTRGITYGCSEAFLSNDGLTGTFKFSNFNVSKDTDLKVCYIAGENPAQCLGVPLEDFEFVFTPVCLVRPDIPIPELKSSWVVDSAGTTLAIEFTEDIIPETIDTSHDAFKIYITEYDMVPGGNLNKKPRTVLSILHDPDSDRILYLTFEDGNTTSLQNGEEIIIEYTNGTLCGYGGPVVFFNHSFTPTNTDKKNNPNDLNHINIPNITASGVFKKVTYHSTKAPDEHAILIPDIEASGVLKRIDEI